MDCQKSSWFNCLPLFSITAMDCETSSWLNCLLLFQISVMDCQTSCWFNCLLLFEITMMGCQTSSWLNCLLLFQITVMDCQTTSWFNCSAVKKILQLHSKTIVDCLSSCQFKWLRWMSVKMFLVFLYLHTKFNLWSAYQAASSNGKMDVNQDVHLIIFLLAHQIHFMVCLSSCQFKWWDGCQSRCPPNSLLVHQIYLKVSLSGCQLKWRDDCQSRCSSYNIISAHQISFMVSLSSCHFKWQDGCQLRCSSSKWFVGNGHSKIILIYKIILFVCNWSS